MAVITISAIPLGEEIVEDIPLLISFETSVPATIYYTLDGSEPNSYSEVYIEPFMPPQKSPVHLRAMAISGADRGYLNVIFATSSTAFHPTRRFDGYGWGYTLDGYETTDVAYDGYGSGQLDEYGNLNNFNPAMYLDEYKSATQFARSKDGDLLYGPNLFLYFGAKTEGSPIEGNSVIWKMDSPNNDNVYFDPRALFIVIDGRDGYQDQSIRMLNGNYGTMHDPVAYCRGIEYRRKNPIVSGNNVRTIWNPEKGVVVFYYYDSISTRWVKSIQNYTPTPDGLGAIKRFRAPFIFQWIYGKRSTI